jgi:hypothetical protein
MSKHAGASKRVREPRIVLDEEAEKFAGASDLDVRKLTAVAIEKAGHTLDLSARQTATDAAVQCIAASRVQLAEALSGIDELLKRARA